MAYNLQLIGYADMAVIPHQISPAVCSACCDKGEGPFFTRLEDAQGQRIFFANTPQLPSQTKGELSKLRKAELQILRVSLLTSVRALPV